MSLEFKRCGAQPEADAFETLCAFANRQGGIILLGVLDDGTVRGIPSKSIMSVERNIINTLNNPQLFNVPPALEMERIDHNGATILKIWVPAGPSVYAYRNVIYDRMGDVDRRVRDDAQIALMYMRKQNMYSERRIYRYVGLSDLRGDILDWVREKVSVRRKDHPWLSMDDVELLRSAKLYVRDRQTGEEGFILASVLLLGSDDLISDVCPAYKTDAITRINDIHRYDDRATFYTNIIEAYDKVLEFAKRHTPDPFILEDGIVVSARDIILRELVSNLFIHREYTSPFVAKIVIDQDGIRTENASRCMYDGEITPENFNPVPKTRPLRASSDK